MKRSLSFGEPRHLALVVAGTGLIAGTYGLVRLAYGLFLPDIRASVAMSSAMAGYVSAGASAGYCLGALVGLVSSHRPQLLVAGALGTAGAGAVGMALAPGLAVLAPSVVLASAGAGLASPGLVGVVGRSLPAAVVDRGQAVVNSGTGPGLIAAGLLALALPDWRVGFAISAAVTVAAGIVVLTLGRTGPVDEPVADTGKGALRLAVLRRPVAAALLLGVASTAVWTYGRTHLVEAGTGTTGSVLAWIAIGVGGTATVLTADAQSRLPAPRAWLLTALISGTATAALAAVGPLPVAVLACAVFGWSFVAATSALIAWTGHLLPQRAAAGTSITFIALVVGQAAGASVAGALIGSVGLPRVFVLAGVVAALAAACGSGAPTDQRKVCSISPMPSTQVRSVSPDRR